MHKAVSRKTMTNIGNDRNIELLTRNTFIMEQSFEEENSNIYEQTHLFRSISIRIN